MLPIHTILCATDFSEPSAAAFDVACTLARDLGARVVAVYVVPPPAVHGEVVARRQPDGFYDSLWSQLHELHAPDGGVRVEHYLAEGDAATEIAHIAEEVDAGLIVIGSHGRSGFSRLVLGSVAEKVLRTATRPVLTVKRPVPHVEASPVAWPEEALERTAAPTGR